ncbi:MAG: hypothetical protein JWQ35_823 [Bacteriovoracaceae bacterium]|nr:hypothetical protein [Bacteriovoracaceae bacterium]
MKKYLVLVAGFLLIGAALSIREWLLITEIKLTETALREQVVESFQNAPNADKIRYLTSSSIAYERYLEPIIEATNRLLWPTSRTEMLSEWKRSLHTQMDDLAAVRSSSLLSEVQKNISKVKSDSKAGLSRLYEILKLNEAAQVQVSCTQTVQEEMKLIQDAGIKRDQDVLASMKSEGRLQLKHLEKRIKGMNANQMSQFLKSGRFVREIQQPVLDYVLQIKQEELRKSAWAEFERKVETVLSHKNFAVAKTKDKTLRAKKEIEQLFNSIAEARGADTVATPTTPKIDMAPAQPFQETETPGFPSSTSDNLGEDLTSDLQSPSDASSNQ